MDNMYKAINVVTKGFSNQEIIVYQTPHPVCIADYAFNTYMYRKDFFTTAILDIAGNSQKNIIKKPDGTVMSHKEINELIEEYYPDAVKKVKEREKIQSNFLGKKLVEFNLLAPWYILYFNMVDKESKRIELLNRLYHHTTDDSHKNEVVFKEDTLPSLEKRMAQHAEEVKKMPSKI